MTSLYSTNSYDDAQSTSLISLFKTHARTSHQQPKVFNEDRSISYADLDIGSDVLASHLLEKNLPAESLVSVLLPRSIEAITSQLGILKANGAYLPMSPEDFPLERICMIFEDASVEFVITDSRYQTLCELLQKKLGRQLHCLMIDKLPATGKTQIADKLHEAAPPQADRLAYVMYTSGSTGKPKGVMITQKNIISTLTDSDCFTLEEHDALLHAAPISFDAATFEIWAALLNGKDLYIVSEQTVHQFDAFSDFVNSRPVSIAWLTSALFNLLADTKPTFFQSFREILVGGEALSPQHINLIRKLYPKLVIRNNYGPTENTIFSTSFLINADYPSNIPIGRAIKGKRTYILDDSYRKVSRCIEGELFVAGDGVSPGYLNLPDETLEKFLPDPFFPGEFMYATGDICRFNEQDDIEFIGRRDKQVKVSGHRIELGEIETALQACPQIKQAVVLYKKLSSSLKGLAAYIKTDQIDEVLIREQLAAKLPSYMIPIYFEAINEIPLSINGKVDRGTMQGWPLAIKTHIFSTQEDSLKQDIEATVIHACQQVLQISSVELSQSFFELGGDSLSGTSLILDLEHKLGITLPLQTLYENPCIGNLLKAINKQLMPQKTDNQIPESFSLFNEAKLDENIRLNGRSIHICHDLKGPEAQIFLTGATGFFGTFLLKELLLGTSGRIHCLVRADDERHAKQRILRICREYKIQLSTRQLERITAIPGDLSKPNLGLAAEQYAYLTHNMDVIFHNGASVNYVDTYSTLKGPNVVGTGEILKLASQDRIIPVHYISSVSVFETLGFFTGRQTVFEHESVDLSEHHVRLGYSQSKWVAEKMMENARSQGMPINIYRSGYIMGHSETGVSNTTDHIARYIAGCIEMGCAPILQEYASLSPVDQLSKALCHIALNSQSYGKTLHLCNPQFITVDEIYQKIRAAGFPLELMSYARWKEKLKQVPSTNPLYPLLSLHIHPAPSHELTLPELYEHNTRFDCTHFLAELEGTDIRISLQTPYLFERWLQDYLKNGLISKDAFNRARTLDCIA